MRWLFNKQVISDMIVEQTVSLFVETDSVGQYYHIHI